MCMFCKCDTVTPSLTTHVVNYNGAIIVIKNVPCEECEQCGEKFYTDDVAEKLEKMVSYVMPISIIIVTLIIMIFIFLFIKPMFDMMYSGI